jgi:hypothetical protein
MSGISVLNVRNIRASCPDIKTAQKTDGFRSMSGISALHVRNIRASCPEYPRFMSGISALHVFTSLVIRFASLIGFSS